MGYTCVCANVMDTLGLGKPPLNTEPGLHVVSTQVCLAQRAPCGHSGSVGDPISSPLRPLSCTPSSPLFVVSPHPSPSGNLGTTLCGFGSHIVPAFRHLWLVRSKVQPKLSHLFKMSSLGNHGPELYTDGLWIPWKHGTVSGTEKKPTYRPSIFTRVTL